MVYNLQLNNYRYVPCKVPAVPMHHSTHTAINSLLIGRPTQLELIGPNEPLRVNCSPDRKEKAPENLRRMSVVGVDTLPLGEAGSSTWGVSAEDPKRTIRLHKGDALERMNTQVPDAGQVSWPWTSPSPGLYLAACSMTVGRFLPAYSQSHGSRECEAARRSLGREVNQQALS